MSEGKNRVCANNNCQKALPPRYKHKYCEACRNKQAEKAKGILKGLVAAAGTVVTVAAAAVAGGKINPKK